MRPTTFLLFFSVAAATIHGFAVPDKAAAATQILPQVGVSAQAAASGAEPRTGARSMGNIPLEFTRADPAPIIETVAFPDLFIPGAKLFSDRDYLSAEVPELLRKARFLRSTIETVEVVCRQSGMVVALTPVPKPGTASQEAALLAAGFERLDAREYQLFPGDINRVGCYGKVLQVGEKLTVKKWVVLVFPEKTRIVRPENDIGDAVTSTPAAGEVLYNGIVLPKEWPPTSMNPNSDAVMAVPYLENPPTVIPIKLGRQLFVDDFLVASTTFTRTYHTPQKYAGNPVLKPETALELQNGLSPAAAPFSDGVFYDGVSRQLKMWYQAGWFDGTAMATSSDGFRWQRPALGIVAQSNRVIPDINDMRRDGASVWLDTEATDPAERYKMLLYTRYGHIGQPLPGIGTAHILTSPDGAKWDFRGKTEPTWADNTTFFYNPFRRKWVFAIKSENRGRRTRDYWECDDFVRDEKWGARRPVFWLSSDELDQPDPKIGDYPQLYKLDAVAYESLMVGIFQVHYGPTNEKAAAAGIPKTTDLQVGFSRDGFHWVRPERKAFIAASRKEGSWERGYITCAGGCFIVTNDSLLFYYTGFRGDGRHRAGDFWSGLYANASTGLAVLRRDGFVSMDAGPRQESLTTRPVVFDGNWLFVNIDAPQGELLVEILDIAGRVLRPFAKENCLPVSGDSTRRIILWKDASVIGALKGQTVRFKFYARNARLYSFWVSESLTGESGGYLAAGRIGSPLIRDIKPNN